MIQRCTNPSDSHYRYYGARGISVCQRWLKFEAFYEDMGARPSPRYSIERVNNTLGYSPENCVWATKKQQQRNTRFNRNITCNGQTKCLGEWAEHYGIDTNRFYQAFYRRLRTSASQEIALARTISEYCQRHEPAT